MSPVVRPFMAKWPRHDLPEPKTYQLGLALEHNLRLLNCYCWRSKRMPTEEMIEAYKPLWMPTEEVTAKDSSSSKAMILQTCTLEIAVPRRTQIVLVVWVLQT
jgi:hypothetical protein